MRTAMYLRISSEDADLRTGEKDESESISNQRSLLREYVSGHAELAGSEILEFCDDGWSGTNFERPAVKELLEQVKHRQINCIIVKDLSRFGRDYDIFLEGASPTKIAVALTEQGMHADGHALSAVLALAYTADLDGTMQCAGNDPGIAGGIGLHLLVDRLGGSKKNALCSR